MDNSKGQFEQISEKKFEEQMEKPTPMVFKTGEIIEIRGSRLRVEKIWKKKITFKLLPQSMVKKNSLKNKILEECKKGNIVVDGADGLQVIPIKEFIKQPVEGMLYDLNRDAATILTFINNQKWVNDYAVMKVIIELKKRIKELENN